MKKIKTNMDWIVALLLFGTIIGGTVVIAVEFFNEIGALSEAIVQGLFKSFL